MSLEQYVPTDGERGSYQGFLSTFAEYHAVGVGFLFYLIDPAFLGPIIGYGIGRGSARGGEDTRPLSGSAWDASKELAYVALGVGLAIGMEAAGVA